MLAKILLVSTLCASLSSASPLFSLLQSRAVIDHDAVEPFDETVPSGTAGTLYLKYKPFLKVFNGCVPFPAVQANGDTSGGLEPTGDTDGDCSSSTGQVYSRATTFNDRYAIMYSWYMPKDEASDGLGHRHDWENIVVWLDSYSTDAETLSFTVSAHGEYDTSSDPSYDGSQPLVGYESYYPLNHQLIFTDEEGGEQPLIAWESLTDAARTALEDTDFGDATVPFKNSTFTDNLQKAIDAES